MFFRGTEDGKYCNFRERTLRITDNNKRKNEDTFQSIIYVTCSCKKCSLLCTFLDYRKKTLVLKSYRQFAEIVHFECNSFNKWSLVFNRKITFPNLTLKLFKYLILYIL